MADILALTQAIGEAYALHASDRPGAVKMLRETIEKAPDLRPLAEKKREDLAALVKARTVGGRCGCVISKTTHELLTEALNA